MMNSHCSASHHDRKTTYLLIIVFVLFSSPGIFSQSAEIVPDAQLTEQTLDVRYLNITLTDEEFTGTGTLANGNFTFNNAPTGLGIESVTASDLTHAVMQLSYPPENDFDSPVTNFSINVSGAVLTYTPPGDVLTSNPLTITAYVETPQAYLSIDSTLEERRLDVRTLTIDLVEERFRDYTTLQNLDFELFDEPPGLLIGSVTGTSATSVDIDLSFNFTDFDANYPNFRISIDQSALVQSVADLVSDPEPVYANIESATLTPDVPLWEDNLEGRTLTVTLINEVFQTPGSVDRYDFVLMNFPIGLTITGASAISATQAQLTLQYTGLDFDMDINNFAVGISPGELRYTSSGNLITAPITIHAITENPSAILTSDDVLTENTLDIRELVIALEQEQFDPAVTINASHFRLVNGPPGLTIESASRISTDSARILLQFVYDDFDNDIHNFHVEIQSSALIQTTSGWLASDSLTIYADIENPVARLSADSALNEERLDYRTLYIELEEERFTSWGSLQTNHFALENRPMGLTIDSVYGTNPTNATIVLNFTGMDFDNDFPGFRVRIDSLVLVQSTRDLLTTPLTIKANLEPVITGVSIPDDTMKIGDTVRVYIAVESDQGDRFSLNSGEIGGYSLDTTLRRLNDTTYEARFIVSEFGNYYLAYENIPVTGLQLFNGLIRGNIYQRFIIQDHDLLDANRPKIEFIVDKSLTEPHDIGSTIKLRIRTDEAGCTFDPASHVNYVSFSRPAIQIHDTVGYYDLFYTVEEDDYDVSEGNLELEVIAIDVAGNKSDPYTQIDLNNLSIDASRPVIQRAFIRSEDSIYFAGETLEISVVADQPEYRNHESTRINHVPEGPFVTLIDLGAGNYRYRYTVQEHDSTVYPGELEINIVLQDRLPYENMSDPFPDLDSNNVAIYPRPPSAIVSGDTAVCYGDSALVTIRLEGFPPFEFDLADGTDTVTYSLYDQDIDTFWVHPTDTTRYTVPRVVDGHGNSNVGSGSALITVHPYLDVQIKNLLSSYILYDSAVELVGSPEGGKFSGNGITAAPWTFTPSSAGTENSPHEIVYTYTDPNTTCFNADTVIVEVIDAPGIIHFEKSVACFNDSIFYITGINKWDSAGRFSIEPEPPPGAFIDNENNTAVLFPAIYDLGSTVQVYITYTFTDAEGEVQYFQDTLTIEWISPAQITPKLDDLCDNEAPVELTGHPVGGYFSGTGVTGNRQDGFRFDPSQANPGTNIIHYVYTSDNHCSVQDARTIFISPTYTLSEDSYFENFEDTLHGWRSIAEEFSPRNSWIYGEVDSDSFPWDAASGSRAWYTKLPASEFKEYSWVQSPCFNFEGFSRSMVSFDMKHSLDPDEDGVVMQYTVDNRDHWNNVGKMNDGGLYWYNSKNIWEGPAGQNIGWTGEEEVSEEYRWYRAAHTLDDTLTRYKDVQFRMAYGSNGRSTIPNTNKGFAFDNFSIKKRSRLSVLEYFTDANTAACHATDSLVFDLMGKVPYDAIDIQYHYPDSSDMPDQIYLDNPIPGNSRAAAYGVSEIPMAILDGGGGGLFKDVLGYPLVYDFSSLSYRPTAEDIRLRSLIEPYFKLSLDIEYYSSRLLISISIEALKGLTKRELVLHTVVLEKWVTGTDNKGTNGPSKFCQVARKMLPDHAGSLFNKSWKKGDIQIVTLEYQKEFFTLHKDSIAVVVYLQDESTWEILQAAVEPVYTPDPTFIRAEPQIQVKLYPNPAREWINVYLETVPREPMRFTLYNLSGMMVVSDIIQPWQQQYTRSVRDLEQGMYIVVIRTDDNRCVVFRGKLLHY